MKKWLVVAASGIAACQANAPETEIQSISQGDYCGAETPPVTQWKPGLPLPPSTSTTAVITSRITTDLWNVYGADPVVGKVRWHLVLKTPDMIQLQGLAVSNSLAYGGSRGPVGGCAPRCGDPPGSLVLAYANRLLQVPGLAEGDDKLCGN